MKSRVMTKMPQIQTMMARVTNMLRSFLLVPAIIVFANLVSAQVEPPYVCGQAKDLRESLINEAEQQEFNVRRIEFVGNIHYSGRKLFARTGPIINEGDIFKR